MGAGNIIEIPELLGRLLADREIFSRKEIDHFLFPKLSSLPHPSKMKALEDAAERVCIAIEKKKDIVIWGDYDVDGTSGTSLLLSFFKDIGIEASYYIPDRLKEGYGLKGEVLLREFPELLSGNFLLITVDCGISDSKEVAKVTEGGGEVIVTDHHQLPLHELPACVVVNPSQDGCGFGKERLAGVGVAFFLAAAVRYQLETRGYFSSREKPNMKKYLGFVALGTISDLVELTTTNRVLVKAGLEVLSESDIPGLRSLVDSAGIGGGSVNSEDIGFALGPRINAAGRLGSAQVAVDLMVCDNIAEGAKISKVLEEYNDRRKRLCEESYQAALTSEGNGLNILDNCVVCEGDFHTGIIGIVASRLVDRFNKPSLVFGKDSAGEGRIMLKGSGRSVDGVDLIKCLHGCRDLISRYGGHQMAAGLTVAENDLEEFSLHFNRQVGLEKRNSVFLDVSTKKQVECSIDDVMDSHFLKYFSLLEPFGPGNERPVFQDTDAAIVNCKAIGADKQHLQLIIRGRYENYRAVAFGLGSRIDEIRKGRKNKILFTPMVNRYRNSESWQVRVTDIETG